MTVNSKGTERDFLIKLFRLNVAKDSLALIIGSQRQLLHLWKSSPYQSRSIVTSTAAFLISASSPCGSLTTLVLPPCETCTTSIFPNIDPAS